MLESVLREVKQGFGRYATAVFMIVLLVAVLSVNSEILVWTVLAVLYFISFYEALRLYGQKLDYMVLVTAVITWLLSYYMKYPVLVGVLSVAFLAGLNSLLGRCDQRSVLVLIYPTIPFLSLLTVYTGSGVLNVVWLLVTSVMTDTMSYFGGRSFGRLKLSVSSPGKTIEGAVVGVLFGTVVGSMVGIGVIQSLESSVVISFVTSIATVLGDLYESQLKRIADVKDSGNMLPGHGGVLDRVDGVLFASMVMCCVVV